jgi:hypothetical protein
VRRWRAFALLAVAYFMTAVDKTNLRVNQASLSVRDLDSGQTRTYLEDVPAGHDR